jgi:hypothetical protein
MMAVIFEVPAELRCQFSRYQERSLLLTLLLVFLSVAVLGPPPLTLHGTEGSPFPRH